MPEGSPPTTPPAGAPPAPRKATARAIRPPDAKEDFRYIVRFANTDLDGAQSVVYALQKVKGVGPRIAEMVADLAAVPRSERIGNLPETRTEGMEKALATLHERGPPWVVNRPTDPDLGQDAHLFGADVDLRRRDDIHRMQMIRCS